MKTSWNQINNYTFLVYILYWSFLGINTFCRILLHVYTWIAISYGRSLHQNIPLVLDKCKYSPLPRPCENRGYQDHDDCTKCKCPDGLTGRYCEQTKSNGKTSASLWIRRHRSRKNNYTNRINQKNMKDNLSPRFPKTSVYCVLFFSELWFQPIFMWSVDLSWNIASMYAGKYQHMYMIMPDCWNNLRAFVPFIVLLLSKRTIGYMITTRPTNYIILPTFLFL